MIRRLLRNERGTAVLLTLGFMIFLLAMVGFAVDLAYQMTATGELERSMEAAALAVMHRVLGQPEHVIHFGDPDVDRVYGHWFAFPDWTWVEAALHKSAGWTYGRAPPIMGA